MGFHPCRLNEHELTKETMMTTTAHTHRSRAIAGTALAASALTLSACFPEQPAPQVPSPTTTSTTTTAGNTNVDTITAAKLDLRLNAETDMISHSGEANYWSAGISDSTAGTYTATNGNATVYRKVNGVDTPVGTGGATWANKKVSENGTTATIGNKLRFGYHTVFTGGTGSRNTTTGAATVQWTGTFSVTYYGNVPFWLKDPKLTVAPGGSATLTAQAQGAVGDRGTEGTTGQITPWTNVTLAEFNVDTTQSSFVAQPKYVGVVAPPGLEAPQSDPAFTNPLHFGSYPASWVRFQDQVGLGAFWYSTGSTSDRYKLPDTFTVNYNG